MSMDIDTVDNLYEALASIRGVRDLIRCLDSHDKVDSMADATHVLSCALDRAEERLAEAVAVLDEM